MQKLSALRGLFKYQSGRVIALGRVMLCFVLLMAVAADRSEPHLEWARTYSLLMAYAAAALIIAAATFHTSGHTEVAEIQDAFKLLTPLLGGGASVVFALALPPWVRWSYCRVLHATG